MTISVSTTDMIRLKTTLSEIKGGVPKVMSRAINRTLKGTQTDSVDEAAKRLNLTKKRIRKDYKITNATAKNPKGTVAAKGKPINLGEFAGTRLTQKGVSIKVKKTSKRTILKHAFIRMLGAGADQKRVFSRMYSGSRAKFNPLKKYAKMPKKYRLPIEKLDGPRIEDILSAKEVSDRINVKAAARYLKNISHETDYLLSQQK